MRLTLMILPLSFALPTGCATRAPTTILEVIYVHESDTPIVRPGEEWPGGGVNLTTNKYWLFTPVGLKAALTNEYGKALLNVR